MTRKTAEDYGYNYDIPLDEFFQFAISVDCVIYGFHGGKVKVMLIKRGANPYKGKWALPGDLVYPREALDDAAKRVLTELTGLEEIYMKQVRTFGAVDRHTLGRVVTLGYMALIEMNKHPLKADDWAEEIDWFEIHEIPDLAFDHNEIFSESLKFLQQSLESHSPVGFEMMPKKFTLLDYLELTEYVLNKRLDKANFRKKLLAQDFIEPLEEVQKNVKHRPAKLYKINKKKIELET